MTRMGSPFSARSMPAGRASVRPEGEEVNHDERRMPVSGLFCLDRADGLLVVGLVCPLAAVKVMNEGSPAMLCSRALCME
jgi:hypothetical protein